MARLRAELVSWSYKPNPVRRVEIPKPTGGVRLLGVPCVRDRVLQASLKLLLEPIFDPGFSESSYGFRPGKNQRQAVEAGQRYAQAGKDYVVDLDLSKYFDRINHDRLLMRVKEKVDDTRILKLIGMTLRSGVMTDGLTHRTTEGTTQGSPLSPLLSNIVLDELDKELERRGLEFCRFADDANISGEVSRHDDRPGAVTISGRRIRARLVGNKKRRWNLAKALEKAGVRRQRGAKTAYSNHSWWALSNMFAVTRMYPNKWFEELGMFLKSQETHDHWFAVSERVCIP